MILCCVILSCVVILTFDLDYLMNAPIEFLVFGIPATVYLSGPDSVVFRFRDIEDRYMELSDFITAFGMIEVNGVTLETLLIA